MGNGTALQYSCLENPMDRGPWGAAVHGVTRSRTRLSDFNFTFHFSLSRIGEGNGNPLQCSCLENPRDRGAWWAAVYGVAQSRTRLKWCSRRKIKDMFIQWYMNMKMFIVDLFIRGKGSNCPSMGRVNKFWYTHTVNITQQSKGMNCWICTGVDAFSSSFCFDNISPFSVSAL